MSAGPVVAAIAAAAVAAVAAGLAIGLATTSDSPTYSASGYPSPVSLASPDPIPTRIAPWSAIPRTDDVAPLLAALDDRDAAGVAEAIGTERLDVGPPSAGEGWGVSIGAQDAADVLAALFAGGVRPMVRGAFVPGADAGPASGAGAGGEETEGNLAGGEIVIVLTGLDFGPAAPTLPLGPWADGQGDPLGPAVPSALPLGAAAWHVLADGVGGGRWQRWSAAEGYEILVTALGRSGLGTYWAVDEH